MRPIVTCLVHHSLWHCLLEIRFLHLLALVQVLALLALIVAVLAVAWQLWRQARAARLARTIDTLDDHDDLEQDARLSDAQRATLESNDREQVERLLATDAEAAERIEEQARFYESLARAVQHRVVERRVVMAELAPRLTEAYERLLPYLELERSRHPGAYAGFAQLYRDALKHLPKLGKSSDAS